MINFKKKKQKGYAILFTVIIVSAISVITAGLSNAAYKQLILSSLAKDSQTAFFQADTAADCALFVDAVALLDVDTKDLFVQDGIWSCGDLNLVINIPTGNIANGYELNSPSPGSLQPCFSIKVTKTDEGLDSDGNAIISTNVSAKGYNICDKSNLRTVEREIQIDY